LSNHKELAKKDIGGENLEGWRIVKINSMEDLKKADYDWALEQGGVSLDEVIGCYVIIGDKATFFEPQHSQQGITEQETIPIDVTIITNVDVRLYWEKAKAWIDMDGNLWITDEEMERVTS